MKKEDALFELRLMLGEEMFLMTGCLITKKRFPEYEIPETLTKKIEAIKLSIRTIEKSMK